MKRPAWLSRNVLFLGLVSLFTDAATEMAMPLMPAFILSLGGGAMALGAIEGAADLTAAAFKYLSGRWSDARARRKPLVAWGYGLSSAVRPLLALVTAPWQALLVRVTDRMGKGLRSSPRDALLSSSVPLSARGRAFGFHQGMDHTGAVIGPLIAVALLAATHENLRLIFALMAVPGALALAAVLWGVKESATSPLPLTSNTPPSPLLKGEGRGGPLSAGGEVRSEISPLLKGEGRGGCLKSGGGERFAPPSAILPLLIPLALFTLGASSDLFLLMKAGASKTPLYGLPLLWILLHVVKAAASYPGGWLADRWGERRCILAGWTFYAVVYAAFAFAESRLCVIGLFLAYGLYYGLCEGPEKALVSKLAPEKSRGAAFGWYHLVVGAMTLPANLLFGWLHDAASPRAAFLFSSGMALAGAAALGLLGRRLPARPLNP